LDLGGDRLYIEDRGVQVGPVAWGTRIGIRVGREHPWRAWVEGNGAVSVAGARSIAAESTQRTPRTQKAGRPKNIE